MKQEVIYFINAETSCFTPYFKGAHGHCELRCLVSKSPTVVLVNPRLDERGEETGKVLLFKEAEEITWVDITDVSKEDALDLIFKRGGRTIVADGDEEDLLPNWFYRVDMVWLGDVFRQSREIGRKHGFCPIMDESCV